MNFLLLTQLIPIVMQIVPLVERLIGDSTGEEKRELAISMIVPGLRAAELAAGRELVDEDVVAEAAGKVTDGVVTILNEAGVLGQVVTTATE